MAVELYTANDLLGSMAEQASAFVEEEYGTGASGDVWRAEPPDWRTFVESKGHLNLPSLYDGPQADAMDAILGKDPKRIFEEPEAGEPIPLSWAKVRSSNVARIGWAEGFLYVAYRDNGVYAYQGVDRDLFEVLLDAKSKGKAVAACVKGRPYEKLDVAAPDDVNVRVAWDGRLYQMAVLLWGKGSGKDYLCSILVAYLVCVLLHLRDPQRYLELAPGENIDIVNVAYNADQAKRVFFLKFTERLKRWRWLMANYNVFESGKRVNEHVLGRQVVQINDDHVLFPKNIRSFSRHAQNESYEGLNVIAWVMDEASAFLSPTKRENAEKIYGTLRTSAATRFKRRWVGLVISYPRHGDDFTMTKHAEAERNRQLGIYPSGPFKTWEVNKVLGRGEWVEVRPGHWVPIELAADYETLGFEEALARFECQPPSAVDALIKFPDRLWAAVRKGKPSLIRWEPRVTRYEVGAAGGGTQVREYAAVKVTSWGKRLPRGTRMYVHGDPALTTDGFAVAFGHPTPATVMRHVAASEVMTADQIREAGIDREKIVQWEQDVHKTIIDALIVWQPDPRSGRQVDMENVSEVLLEAAKHHRIEAITFDNWGFFDAIQRLQRRKLNVENEAWSNPHQLQMYTGARSAFYNDLVELPDDPTITSRDPLHPGALYELERVQLIEARKIDHPENGSKDLADAVVRVIQHVNELGQKAGISFGTAYGHQQVYGGAKVSARPVQNPEQTPSPVTSALKGAEAQRVAQRPEGEVRPDQPGGTRQITADEAAKLARQARPAGNTRPLGVTTLRR